jgi:anaerobic ribonucleoside-triphosphate reductase activating protein
MKINKIIRDSRANGPGIRYVLWTQGCDICCNGCSNKDTWDPELGTEMPVKDIIEDIKNQQINGLTITCGEPLLQFPEVLELLKCIYPKYNVLLTSGHTMDVIKTKFSEILQYVDILISGPYISSLHNSGPTWRGSTNQIVHFLTERSKNLENSEYIGAEIRVSKDGNALITGFNIDDNILRGGELI